MKMGNERFALLSIVIAAIVGFGLFLLRETGSEGDGVPESPDYAVQDIAPDADPEALPPILRRRAARKGGETDAPSPGSLQSPIELELSLIDAFESGEGGQAVVGVRLRPRIDAPDLRWTMRLPEGLRVVSGEPSWDGRLAQDEERTFQVVVDVPDGKRYEIYARAELDTGDDLLTRGAGLRIDLGEEEKGDYPLFERVGEDGRSVNTYKGRVREGGE